MSDARRRPGGGRARLAATIAIACIAMTAVAVLLAVTSFDDALRTLGLNGVGNIVLGFTYPFIGWLIASRRPDNRIGWLFLAIGVSQAGSAFASAWGYVGVVLAPGSLPFGLAALWMSTWIWAPGFTLLFAVVALFPDGRLPGPRWRWVPALAAAEIALTVVPMMIVAARYAGPELLSAQGPDLSQDPSAQLLMAVAGVANVLTIPLAIGALGALVRRYRTSSLIGRVQVRWLVAAGFIEVMTLVGATIVPPPYPLDVLLAIVVMPLVPAAVTVAILRYRLFEIDRIISRTVSWALVSGVLIAVFAGTTLALTTLLDSYTDGNTLTVAASTLAAAALFQPIRRHVQRLVDHRFNRARLDADRTATAFATQLRAEAGLQPVTGQLRDTVAGALQPQAVSVWIRGEARR